MKISWDNNLHTTRFNLLSYSDSPSSLEVGVGQSIARYQIPRISPRTTTSAFDWIRSSIVLCLHNLATNEESNRATESAPLGLLVNTVLPPVCTIHLELVCVAQFRRNAGFFRSPVERLSGEPAKSWSFERCSILMLEWPVGDRMSRIAVVTVDGCQSVAACGPARYMYLLQQYVH